MIKKTLGGDRLGSGNRLKAELHNYERSTHDLGNVWRSTMAPGVLTPCFKKICHDGDTWTINLQELVRTMPAVGPCFGSYKMQIDVFEVPIRLYNGILHNNMTKIGMDMAKVKLPKFSLQHDVPGIYSTNSKPKTYQVNPSSLIHYLGIKGIGEKYDGTAGILAREFNAVPLLAYYDIFKNYYANKQEENAYVIDTEVTGTKETKLIEVSSWNQDGWESVEVASIEDAGHGEKQATLTSSPGDWVYKKPSLRRTEYELEFDGDIILDNGAAMLYLVFENAATEQIALYSVLDGAEYEGTYRIEKNKITVGIGRNFGDWAETFLQAGADQKIQLVGVHYLPKNEETTKMKLQPFKLENIDKVRIELLKNTTIGTEINITNNPETDILPFNTNWGDNESIKKSNCRFPMQGLVVKTYQSDIFNAWLSKKWVDGVQGINAISAVAVEEGKVTIDAINLGKKVYNMLNRIAVSGGTYEDWREAVYGENAVRHAESPIYCGGASGIIAFEEIVSTADTQTEAAGDQPLGSLAGKGTLTNVKGGNIEIHIKEPSYIIAIASITPLIDYCLGNDFDMTEIDSLDDLHKPELDEIGFQDLILERAAWWTTQWDDGNEDWIKHSGGKIPAWMEWMTSVNEVHGKFAEEEELDFMVLTRRYEKGSGNDNNAGLLDQTYPLSSIPIKDWTTYINPTKFNYQFADTDLYAQNFWVQIGINAICRRKISAKLIPNL